MSQIQKDDMLHVFGDKWKNVGNLDYVSCWYKKATDYMQGTSICTALVSTNSITQGEQVPILWKPLFEQGIHIDFAWKTFNWSSEASEKASVHCVIIGFSYLNKNPKILYINEKQSITALNINAYLLNAPNILVESRNKPLCKVPEIKIGNKPIDGGFYLFTEQEKKEFIKKEPSSEKYFRKKGYVNPYNNYNNYNSSYSNSGYRRRY